MSKICIILVVLLYVGVALAQGSKLLNLNVKETNKGLLITWEKKNNEENKYKVKVTNLGPDDGGFDCNFTITKNSFNVIANNSVNFENTEPYYKYKIDVTAFTKDGMQLTHNTTNFTTKPSKPDGVKNIKYKTINERALISYEPPCRSNGKFKYVQLKYNNSIKPQLQKINNEDRSSNNFTLTLKPGIEYWFHIEVLTNSSKNPSKSYTLDRYSKGSGKQPTTTSTLRPIIPTKNKSTTKNPTTTLSTPNNTNPTKTTKMNPITAKTPKTMMPDTNPTKTTKMNPITTKTAKRTMPAMVSNLREEDVISKSFVVKWDGTKKSSTYNITIKLEKPLHYVSDDCLLNFPQTESIETNTTTYFFQKAYAHSNYSVIVYPVNNIEGRKSITISTKPRKPSTPKNVVSYCNNSNINNCYLSWDYPCPPNGEVLFNVAIHGKSLSSNETVEHEFPVNNTLKNHIKSKLSQLKYYYNYTIQLCAKNVNGTGNGSCISTNLITPTNYPMKPHRIETNEVDGNISIKWINLEENVGKITRNQVIITNMGPAEGGWDCDFKKNKTKMLNTIENNINIKKEAYLKYKIEVAAFTETGMGPIATKEFTTKPTKPQKVKNLNYTIQQSNNKSYHAVISFQKPCRTNGKFKHIQLNYTTTKNSTIQIVNHKNSSKSFTIPLEEGVKYKLSVKVITDSSESDPVVNEFEAPKSDKTENTTITTEYKMEKKLRNNVADEDTNLAVVASLGSITLLVAIVALGYIFVKYYLPKLKYRRVTTEDTMLIGSIDTERSIDLEFKDVEEKSKSIYKLSNEGKISDNRLKNRYGNIIPYDDSRVVLDLDPDDMEASDYINASYIKGYSGTNEYIACQAPKDNTCADFWRMILQNDVKMIVMLCQFIEFGKPRCSEYFPTDKKTLKFKNVKVKVVSKKDHGYYRLRKIQVADNSKKLTVYHMHFLNWDDFGVPTDTNQLIKFCKKMRSIHKSGYIVVHCSAGVGRTGTFITLDIGIQSYKISDHNFCVRDTVLRLREDRMNMVQTVAQYKYLHNTINYYEKHYCGNKRAIYVNLP